MSWFKGFFSDSETKDFPLKIKDGAINEAKKELKIIHKRLDEWAFKANEKDIDIMLSNNPDFVIDKMINHVINISNQSNQYTISHLISDIRENSSLDAVDLIVALQMIDEKNDIVDELLDIEKTSILSQDDKKKISKLIIKLIALNEGIKKTAKISRHYYYGWSDYFDRENNIRLNDLKNMIDQNNQSISRIRIGEIGNLDNVIDSNLNHSSTLKPRKIN